MKGVLLVLTLLITSELGFQTAEACPIFYELFIALGTGSRILLNAALNPPNATAEERKAFEKIQDCYNENGFRAKSLDAKLMTSITLSKQCLSFYTTEETENIKELLEKIKAM